MKIAKKQYKFFINEKYQGMIILITLLAFKNLNYTIFGMTPNLKHYHVKLGSRKIRHKKK